MSWLLWLSLAYAGDPALVVETVEQEPPVAAGVDRNCEQNDCEESLLVDRSAPPPVVASSPIALPAFDEKTLPGGVKLRTLYQEGLRRALIQVRLFRGRTDMADSRPEIASFYEALVTKATKNYSSESLELETDLHDIGLYLDHGLWHSTLSVMVPAGDVEKGFELLNEVLFRPSFSRKELKLHREENRRYYQTSCPTSPACVANSALSYAWFPEESVYGTRPDLDLISAIKRSTLKARHLELLTDAPIELVVVGDWSEEQILNESSAISSQLNAANRASKRTSFVPQAGHRVIGVDMPAGSQTVIRYRLAAPVYEEPDASLITLANWALGGHFLSRLNRNLREEKGLTYGVYSSYYSVQDRAHFTVRLDVAAENTSLAVQEILGEFGRLAAEGLSEQELADAKTSQLMDWNKTLESSDSTADFYTSIMDYDETVSMRSERIKSMVDVPLATVNGAAGRWFTPNAVDGSSVLVVVGPRTEIEKQDWEGVKIQWISAEDAILGSF
jgi:zinc protease